MTLSMSLLQRMPNPDLDPVHGWNEEFGFCVAIDQLTGTTAVIGCKGDNPAGTAYGAALVFEKQPSGQWLLVKKLQASDKASNDYFGYSVAIHGDWIAVGAPGQGSSGKIYMFNKSGGVWPGTETSSLSLTHSGYLGDWKTLALHGDVLMVGIPADDDGYTNNGTVRVCCRSGSSWPQQAKLNASNEGNGKYFGGAVSFDPDGSKIIVGAGESGSIEGEAYIFSGSGAVWSEDAKLSASNPGSSDQFGRDVSIKGQYALVGAFNKTTTSTNDGAVYLFRNTVGTTWVECDYVPCPVADSDTNANFGYELALGSNCAVIGARGQEDPGDEFGWIGSLYFYSVDTDSHELVYIDRYHTGVVGELGNAVDICGLEAVGGAHTEEVVEASNDNNGVIYFVLLEGEAVYPVKVPVGATYVDDLHYDNPSTCIEVINTIPEYGEVDVAYNTEIWLHVVGLTGVALNELTLVYITSSYDGVRHLAYDQDNGGFQTGYSGTATIRQSPGSSVNDELVLEIVPATPYTSLATILVEVYASTSACAPPGGFYKSYTFTIEDLTAPELEEILWFNPRWARLKFDEPVSQSTEPGGSLFTDHFEGGVEVLSANTVLLPGATLTSSMVGFWFCLAGSAYPQNNGYRKISAVDTSSAVLTLTTGGMIADNGIDYNEAGIIAQRRTLKASITPYRFVARLSDEGASSPNNSADKIQCAYEPIPTRVSEVPEEELPATADPREYIYIWVHDDISLRRLYTVYATKVLDLWSNEMIDNGLDFQAPAFGAPLDRINMWSDGIFPPTDKVEDLEHEAQLRKMAVVLNDLFNVLWYRVDMIQYLDDPHRCPESYLDHLLYNLGNPFTFPLETVREKRILGHALRNLYKKIGTIKGILEMLYDLLGIEFEIKMYVTADCWLLGDAVWGVLGFTTILAPSTAFAKNCYEVISPVALTDKQIRIIKDVCTWSDPVDLHLVRIVEDIAGGESHSIMDITDRYVNVPPLP